MRVPLVHAPELKLRPRTGADDEFISALSAAAFGEYAPAAAAYTVGLARRANCVSWILQLGSEPIGFALIELSSPVAASLQAIAVGERWRGSGHGRRLLMKAEASARALQARSLRLCTAESNLAALELFTKHGFRIERRAVRYYARGQDAYLLVKELL
jgi:ribosomal protein S18 acetylase RimI-like enzyme